VSYVCVCHQYIKMARLFIGLCYLGLPTWITAVWGMEISALSGAIWISSKERCLQVIQWLVNTFSFLINRIYE
jgi:hypothetical protein